MDSSTPRSSDAQELLGVRIGELEQPLARVIGEGVGPSVGYGLPCQSWQPMNDITIMEFQQAIYATHGAQAELAQLLESTFIAILHRRHEAGCEGPVSRDRGDLNKVAELKRDVVEPAAATPTKTYRRIRSRTLRA